MPAKMTATISSSVSSSEPGTDVSTSLRPPTSTSVSSMIANSAAAAIRPHSTVSSRRGSSGSRAAPDDARVTAAS